MITMRGTPPDWISEYAKRNAAIDAPWKKTEAFRPVREPSARRMLRFLDVEDSHRGRSHVSV